MNGLTNASQRDASVVVAGEQLVLLPQRAVYWSSADTLLIADTHFGKEATFRSAAVPIPDCTAADLQRLDRALQRTGASRLVILGDLIHARAGRSAVTFQTIHDWRQRQTHLEILLIRGNHDRSAGDPPESWQIACHDEPFVEPPFCFRHDPAGVEPDRALRTPSGAARGRGTEQDGGYIAQYILAGHRHPKVKLTGPAREETRLPCFLFGRECGVLPAFSDFVDGARIRPSADDRVFVVADDQVLPV